MTRREKKGAPQAVATLSVPGIRVVVAGHDQAPQAAPRASAAANSPASAGSAPHRKRRAKFVF